MSKSIQTLRVVVITALLLLASTAAYADWSTWSHMGNADGVRLYSRSEKSGEYTSVQIKMENTNSYRVHIVLGKATFSTSDRGQRTASSEGHYIDGNSTKTNTPYSVHGNVTYINLDQVTVTRQ